MRLETLRPAAGLAAAALGLGLALGPPRFTWANTGLQIAHPPAQGLAALLGALALGLSVAGLRTRALRLAGLAVATALATFGGQRLAWRLEALEGGLVERRLTGTIRMPWDKIDRVESRLAEIEVGGRDGARLRIATGGFPPEDRARLERTISRRVRETTQAATPAVR